MEYVMVPVPEEVLDEVKDFIAWGLGRKDDTAENPNAIVEVYESSDATLKSLLMTVANATLDGERLTLPAVAEQLGINVRELLGALTDLNHHLRLAGGPMAAIMNRPDPRPRPDGVSEFDHKLLHMSDEFARRIADL